MEAWGGKVGPHQSMQPYFHDFVYLSWMLRASASTLQGFLFICLLVDTLIQSTLLSDNRTKNTRIAPHSERTTTALIKACAFPPGFSRPLPAARTHIVSHRRHLLPHLIPSDWPPGSQAFCEIFSHFLFLCFPYSNLLPKNLSIFTFMCLSIDQSISNRPPVSLLSQGCSPKGEVDWAVQETEPLPFGFHYRQTRTSQLTTKE